MASQAISTVILSLQTSSEGIRNLELLHPQSRDAYSKACDKGLKVSKKAPYIS